MVKEGTTIWLVRHGETEWNRAGKLQGHADVQLSELGVDQAHRLARRLSGRSFAALYSSDLQRAGKTAAILGDALDLAPVSLPALREVHVGHMSGLTMQQAMERFPDFFSAREAQGGTVRRPGGESDVEHMERAWEAVVQVADRHPGENVLVVSHGGTIRAILKRAMRLADEYQIRVILGNTSVTVIKYSHGAWYLALLNDTTHANEFEF